jgi:hypothetical protein
MCYIKGMKDIGYIVPKRTHHPSPVFSNDLLRSVMDTDGELNLELLRNAAVSGDPAHTMSACLDTYTKEHLKDLAQDHELQIPSSYKKQQMVGKVADHLVRQFPKMLPFFPQMNLEFLSKFKESPTLEFNSESLKFRDISHVHNYGFLYLFKTGDSFTVVVPRELLPALSILDGKEIWETADFHQRMNAYAISLSNLYGVLDIDQYAVVWNRFEAESLTPAMVMDELEELGKVQYYWWFDDELVISSYFQSGMEVVQFLDKVKQVSYYSPSRNDLLKYFQTPYDDESPAASAMLEFLSGYRLPEGEQIEDLMDDISDTCIVGEGMQDVFDLLNEYGLLFTGMEEINRFTELYTQLSDHCRKWELRGHTPSGLKNRSSTS